MSSGWLHRFSRFPRLILRDPLQAQVAASCCFFLSSSRHVFSCFLFKGFQKPCRAHEPGNPLRPPRLPHGPPISPKCLDKTLQCIYDPTRSPNPSRTNHASGAGGDPDNLWRTPGPDSKVQSVMSFKDTRAHARYMRTDSSTATSFIRASICNPRQAFRLGCVAIHAGTQEDASRYCPRS